MTAWPDYEAALSLLNRQMQRFRKDIRQGRVLREKAERLARNFAAASRTLGILLDAPETGVFQDDAYTYRNRSSGEQVGGEKKIWAKTTQTSPRQEMAAVKICPLGHAGDGPPPRA